MAKKNKTTPDFFYLPPKEEETMKVLWNTKDALSASEIAERIPGRTWPASSIQGIIRSLESKGAVKVDSITKLGKSYGRLFRPVISANEYATMQFTRYFQPDGEGKKACSSMISSLLGNTRIEKDDILDALQDIIKEYGNG
ncbi:MAG: BlaI/MecI/CopY family transcriptional regulator [Lachnospiraceae bacterium]|nr:BlaI/MecI/CopY family transcriptional regulator [Lachnospiraceae bacterium]